MDAQIETIFHELSHTISAKLSSETKRAEEAEANYRALLSKVRAFLEKLPEPANDDSDIAPLDPTPSKVPASRKRTPLVPDEVFLNALSTEWIKAAAMRKLLIDRGFVIAEGTIYNRMRKLVAAHPEIIEVAANPEQWRRKAETVSPKPVSRGKSKALSKKAAKVTGKTHLSVVSAAPANDDEIPRFSPVLHHGDCLEIMRDIPDASVELVLADLPYGSTGLDIDHRIPMEPLWKEYRRIIKPTGNIVLFGSQPFTTDLINAGRDLFKYQIIWKKQTCVGFQHARDKPLKSHEEILIFAPGAIVSAKRAKCRPTYNPQGVIEVERVNRCRRNVSFLAKATHAPRNKVYKGLTNCPRSVIEYSKLKGPNGKKSHPFAKPIDMLEMLIETYSNPGEMVLDNSMGGGSTCLAAFNTGRRSIGIEQAKEWFDYALERIAGHQEKIAA